ncbi:MAG: BACON domain-containing protein, partial [Coprobacter sp.]|nr:BACON domain-containing protein [Coprobacter sp.]
MKSMRLIAECVLVAMAVLCAVSCEKETDSLDEIISGAVTDTIVHNSGDRIALTFGGSASSDAVAVTGSGAWSVTGETSWCKATLAYKNGKTVVVVSVTENEQHESREAELTVSLGDAKYTIAVRQGGKEYRLDYNGGEVQIPIAGGRIWQVSGATDW